MPFRHFFSALHSCREGGTARGERYVLCHCWTRRVQKLSPWSQVVAGGSTPKGEPWMKFLHPMDPIHAPSLAPLVHIVN